MSKPDKRRVHVAEIKKTYKGKVHVSTYLRRTFREDGKVRHETVANISDLPDDLLAVIKNRLATGQPFVGNGGAMTIHRSLPHGNVAAVLGTMQVTTQVTGTLRQTSDGSRSRRETPCKEMFGPSLNDWIVIALLR